MIRKFFHKRMVSGAILVGVVLLSGIRPASAGSYALAGHKAVANAELDTMRGGFVTDSGLQISLGIIKAVVVDGVMQVLNQLNIPNMTNLSKLYNNIQSSSSTTVSSAVSRPQALTIPATSSEPTQAVIAEHTPPVALVNLPSQVQNGDKKTDTVSISQNFVNQSTSQQGNQGGQLPQAALTVVQQIGNMTLIQNNANQKVIQNFTVLNLTSNSATMFRQFNTMLNIRQPFFTSMLH